MNIIVGLGNPGNKYEQTLHNAGFLALDYLMNTEDFSQWEMNKKINSLISKGEINNKEVVLIKPQTFMNESGSAVGAALRWYKVEPNNIILIHDDTDLSLGEYKIQSGRGSAGHKGVSSVIESTGTREFTRIRIGVRDEETERLSADNLVLTKFSQEELKILESTFIKITEEIKKTETLRFRKDRSL